MTLLSKVSVLSFLGVDIMYISMMSRFAHLKNFGLIFSCSSSPSLTILVP